MLELFILFACMCLRVRVYYSTRRRAWNSTRANNTYHSIQKWTKQKTNKNYMHKYMNTKMSVCFCFDIYLFAFQNISKHPLDKNNNSIRTKKKQYYQEESSTAKKL